MDVGGDFLGGEAVVSGLGGEEIVGAGRIVVKW